MNRVTRIAAPVLPAVDFAGLSSTLTRGGWDAKGPIPFGPCGAQFLVWLPGSREGSVIITQAAQDGTEWLHASLALEVDPPTHADMAVLHRAVFGRRRWAYSVWAPTSDHVNIHPNALHLFGRVDGKPVLPDFTQGTGSI